MVQLNYNNMIGHIFELFEFINVGIMSIMLAKSVSRPFFSIIVPAYKAESSIGRCLDSILDQNFIDYEIIVVDDCSPDVTGDICDEYADRDNRVIVEHLSVNGGVVNARDVGLSKAEGVYVVWVDSDDEIEPNRLSAIYNEINLNHPDIVVTGYRRKFIDGKYSSPIYPGVAKGYYGIVEYSKMKSHLFGFRKYGADRCISPSLWDKAVRRELFSPTMFRISHDLKIGDDAPRIYVALVLAGSMSVIDDHSYDYCINPGQMTKGYYGNYYHPAYENYLNIDRIVGEILPEIDISEAINQNICHVSSFAALNEYRNPDRAKALSILDDICTNPVTDAAIVSGAGKALDLYSRIVLHYIRSRNKRMLLFLGRVFFFFVH